MINSIAMHTVVTSNDITVDIAGNGNARMHIYSIVTDDMFIRNSTGLTHFQWLRLIQLNYAWSES